MHSADSRSGHEILDAEAQLVFRQTEPLWAEFRGARLFLTGGTGFFGCWLLKTFTFACDQLSLDASVHVLTRDPDAFARKAPELARHPHVTLVHGDVRDFPFPTGAFSHIIHAAADVLPRGTDQPQFVRDAMIEGAKRVLEFRERCSASTALLVSSGAVYGKQPAQITHMPEDEEAVQAPLSEPFPYAEGKRETERMWRGANAGPIARCYALVGPYLPLDAHFAIGNFIRDGLLCKPIHVQGDGTPRRSYLYAADLAVWLWTILFRGKPARAYNVGSEHDVSIGEVAMLVASCFSPAPPVTVAQTPQEGVPAQRYVPRTARAREELGLKQSVDLHDAVSRTISWYATRPPS